MVSQTRVSTMIKFIKKTFQIIFVVYLSMAPVSLFASPNALALSNEPGSDPTGRSQRNVIEKTPWLDPTACDPTSTSTTGGGGGGGPASPGQTWFMGDSLTYGLKDFGGLEEKLTAKGFTPNRVNDRGGRAIHYAGGGGSGQEAGTGLEAVDNDAEFIRSSKNIVVALGTNDANGTSTTFNAKQEELLNKIKSINPNAKIFWVDVAAVGNGSNYDKNGAQLVNTNIHDNASSRVYSTISQFKFVWGNDQDPKQLASKSLPDPNNRLSSDGIHYAGGSQYQDYANFLVNQLAAGGASTGSTSSSLGGCECRANNQTTGPITLIGDDVVEQAYNFFITKGLTAAQSAGIVGNLMLESGGNVTINPDATNPNGGAYGIAQWLGGRKTALEAYAASQGKPRNDLGVQLEFLWSELEAGNQISATTKKDFLSSVTPQTTPGEAAIIFEDTFERSGGAGIPQRVSNAESVFASFSSNTPGAGGGGTSSECPGSSSTIDPNLPQGTREELYQRIKDSGKITANVELLGNPSMKSTILAVILKLTEKYSFSIGSTMRPGCGCPHDNGSAVDLGNINGQGIPTGENYEAFNQIAADFIKDAATIIPAGGSYIGTPNAKFEAIVKPIITAKGGSTLIETRANGLAEGAHFHLNVPASAP